MTAPSGQLALAPAASDLLTLREAADLARVSVRTVERWVEKRALTAYQFPETRGRRLYRSDVLALLQPVVERER